MLTKLQLAREKYGMRQVDLAKAAGISRPFLALLETNRRRPSPEIARKLAAVLNVDAGWLFATEVADAEPAVDGRD